MTSGLARVCEQQPTAADLPSDWQRARAPFAPLISLVELRCAVLGCSAEGRVSLVPVV